MKDKSLLERVRVVNSRCRRHICWMNKKTRSFSQTAVRESSVGPAYEGPTTRVKTEVVAPARLDPRASAENLPKELGGAKGPEPTRFGDWEHKGRCTDF